MLSTAQIELRLLHFEDSAEAVDEMCNLALESNDLIDTLQRFVRIFNNFSVYKAMLVRT